VGGRGSTHHSRPLSLTPSLSLPPLSLAGLRQGPRPLHRVVRHDPEGAHGRAEEEGEGEEEEMRMMMVGWREQRAGGFAGRGGESAVSPPRRPRCQREFFRGRAC